MAKGDGTEITSRRNGGDDLDAGCRKGEFGPSGKIQTGEGGDIGADGAFVAGQRQILPAALRRRRNGRLRDGQRMNMGEGQNELQRDGQQSQPRAES